MSQPVIVQPDLEAWVWANISDLPNLLSFEYSSSLYDHIGWTYSHFIQIDSRSKRKDDARDKAELVRQRIMALPGVPWSEGVICYVQPIEGPFWLPDADGSPRYLTRFEIRVHPVPGFAGAISGRAAAHPTRHPAASPVGAHDG